MSMARIERETGQRAEAAPRISVVMPVYNAEKLLPECLEALRANTDVDFEIVVVDDTSTDRSREIAAEYGARVVPSGGRLGPAGARNVGAREATGEIIFFVDSDVMVRRDTLRRLAEAFDEDPTLDGVIAVQAPQMRFRDICSLYKNLWMYWTYARRAGEDVPLFYTTAAAIRTRTFVDSGGFDVNYANPNVEDTDYGQKLGQLGYRIRVLPDLEVEHVKGYDLRGLLRVDYMRSVALARLKLRKRADTITQNDTSVPLSYMLSVPLSGLLVLLLLGAMVLRSPALLVTTFLAFLAIIVLNVPFLRLLRVHGGVSSWALGSIILVIELLTAGIGSVVGIATFLAGRKY